MYLLDSETYESKEQDFNRVVQLTPSGGGLGGLRSPIQANMRPNRYETEVVQENTIVSDMDQSK